MADKKITDLQLISAVTDTVNFPGDDTITTYRATAAKIFDYIRGKFQASATITGTGTTLTSANTIVLLDPTSAAFTQALPAVSGLPTGMIITFKNIATNGNVVTLDPNSSETIDGITTLILAQGKSAQLINTGTAWLNLLPGSAKRQVNTQTTTYTATDADDLIICTGTFTLTLPSAAVKGKQLIIKNAGTGVITISRASSDTIDGATSFVASIQYQAVTLISSGSTAWHVVA